MDLLAMIQLVTWDWNGTLLADTQACMDAGNHVIRTYGGTPLPRRTYAATFDFPTTDFYCKQGCDREALLGSDSREVFHEFYERRASKCRTRQGARYVLEWLRESSVRSVILSNHMQHAIAVQLERLGLTEYFEDVLANTDLEATVVGNNKMQRIGRYLSIMDIEPQLAFIVGDSTKDIKIGKSLGMRTIAIRDGYFSTRRLREQNPDHLIGRLAEAVEIFDSI